MIGQEIFYDIAIIFLLLVLSKRIKSKIGLLIIGIILLFNPVMFSTELIRVYRDGIYTSLIIFLIAFTIGLFFNRKENFKKVILYQIGLGLTVSAIYLCREEFIWVVPYLIGTVIITIWYILKDKEFKDKLKKILTYLIPTSIFILSIITIMCLNYKYYGVFELNQYWGKEFKEAYGALTRIKVNEEKKKVPITREALSIGYEISPTFAELKEYLEGEEGKRWAKCGDGDGTEIQGGWIHWAIMRAVESKGYYKDAKTANEFYKKVADEINKACDEGRVESYHKRVSNMVRINLEDIINTFKESLNTIEYENKFYLVFIKSSKSETAEVVDEKMLETFEKITRQKIIDEETYLGKGNEFKAYILENILKIYKKINPILFWISIIISILYLIINLIKKENKENLWILIGLWILYYSRIFVITFTSLTMYTEAINVSYLAPAYVIQLLASMLSIIFFLKYINIETILVKLKDIKNQKKGEAHISAK